MQVPIESQLVNLFKQDAWPQALDLIKKAKPGAFNLHHCRSWIQKNSPCTLLGYLLFMTEHFKIAYTRKDRLVPGGADFISNMSSIINALINNALQLNPHQETILGNTLINHLLKLGLCECVQSLLKKVSEPVKLEQLTTEVTIPPKLFKAIYFVSNFKKPLVLTDEANDFIAQLIIVTAKIQDIFSGLTKSENGRRSFQLLSIDDKFKICLQIFDQKCFKDVPPGYLEIYLSNVIIKANHDGIKLASRLIPFFTTRKFFFEAGLMRTFDKPPRSDVLKYRNDIGQLIERGLERLNEKYLNLFAPEFLRTVKKALCTYAKTTKDLKHSEYKEVIESTLNIILEREDKATKAAQESLIGLMAK